MKVCTCEKEFIKEEPTVLITDGGDNEYLPKPITEKYLTKIQGNIWHILGCRGCRFPKERIEKEFDVALKSSIISCIYQQNEDGSFEYMSDSLDPIFEKYCSSNGINIGEPTGINLTN